MEINVDISAEDIQRQIVDAVAKSAIGAKLQETIQHQVKAWYSYDNPIKGVISSMMEQMAREVIKENYSEQLRAWVAEKVTKEFTEDLFNKLWKSFCDRY